MGKRVYLRVVDESATFGIRGLEAGSGIFETLDDSLVILEMFSQYASDLQSFPNRCIRR